jgi:hypothetical protein
VAITAQAELSAVGTVADRRTVVRLTGDELADDANTSYTLLIHSHTFL